jgi:hypothetical protein
MSDLGVLLSGATASVVTALTMQTLGVDPQSLVYGAIGAGVGTTAAPELGRVRSVLVFVCVVCLCALMGTVAAQMYWGSSPLWRNLIAGGTAAVFHPLFAAIVVRIPEIFDGALRKFGLKQ